jgi:hypothetical protein
MTVQVDQFLNSIFVTCYQTVEIPCRDDPRLLPSFEFPGLIKSNAQTLRHSCAACYFPRQTGIQLRRNEAIEQHSCRPLRNDACFAAPEIAERHKKTFIPFVFLGLLEAVL